MKHYLKVYKQLIKMNFSILLIYRASFVNSLISTLGWGLFQLIFMYLLTSKIKTVYGWTREELMILAVSYVIIIAIFHVFFSRGFDYFSQIIDYGELDNYLVKPVDTQFLVSCSHFGWANFFRVVMGILIMFYFLGKIHVSVTIVNVLGFAVLTMFGVVTIYSIWFLVLTIIIWFPDLTNLVDFLYTINGMARYPSEMIRQTGNIFLLLLIPFTFAVATPTKAIIGKVLSGDVFLLLLTTFFLFYLSRFFWKFALRFYTSASS